MALIAVGALAGGIVGGLLADRGHLVTLAATPLALAGLLGLATYRWPNGLAISVITAFTFGLLAPFFTRLLLATPPAFIATLAGLAMLRILQNAFSVSFGGGYTLGALVCFLVTVADVPIMRIGAPFWGLVLGLATSWLLERE